jgi:hypothetical protein
MAEMRTWRGDWGGVVWEGCRVLFGGLGVGLCVRNRCIVQEREIGWYNIFRAR